MIEKIIEMIDAIRDWCNERFAKKTDLPAKLSELENDNGFVTSTVDNLINYYKKSDTYDKEEIASLIAGIKTTDFRVVDALPETNISTSTIYLVAKESLSEGNIYAEYIYINGSWELIGDTNVNLDGYAKIEDIPTDVENLSGIENYLKKTGDSSSTTITFEQAAQRANLLPGDDLATAFGKLSRYCADLKTVAFTGNYGDINGRITLTNNLLPTTPGTALDAVQGKVLGDVCMKNNLNDAYYQTGDIEEKISDLNFIREHPIVFGACPSLSDAIGGYWFNVCTINPKAIAFFSQLAIGFGGSATRFYDRDKAAWTEWKHDDPDILMKTYSLSGLPVLQTDTFTDILYKLKARDYKNNAVSFGGWTLSYTKLNFPINMGNRFYITIYRYDNGYACADLTDLVNSKKYFSTMSDNSDSFAEWKELKT